MQQELGRKAVCASVRKTYSSLGSPGNNSVISSPGKLSLHTSVTWGGVDSEGDLFKQQVLAPLSAMRLPGILSKAGRLCSSHKYLMKFADVCDEARCKQLEDQVNQDHLQKLERMFREADVEGVGGLDMDDFRKAMKKIMGDISDEDIDVIFMKVDANCDGSVDWEEYLNYMLREYRGKDDMLKSKMIPEFQTTMKAVPVSHSEDIVRIQFFPSQSRGIMDHREKSWKVGSRSPSGRFLTVSRDGILHYWSDAFKMLRTVHLDQTKRRHSLKLWVIDMLCLPNINLLAVSTTDQDIEFFDIGGNKCDRLFSLVDLDGCATAMDYWTDGCRGVFCVGDLKGNVLIFTSTDVITNGLFNVRSYIGGLGRVPVRLLMKGKTTLYRNFTVSAVHGDWCQQVMYIPQLNLVASCTPAEKSAMALTSLPLHNVGKIQSSLIVLRKGILCFDYSPEMNILVTGGYEPLIRIWNPYVTNSPITQLKGHSTAVTHLMINGQRNTIVSISKDKNIRVWDLLDHFCLQSIHGRNVPLGNCPISSVYYHRPHNILICATYTLGLFFGTAEFTEVEFKTQEQPLCCALYNKIFKQAVSGYYSGMITVWDIMTGQKIMEFSASSPEQAVEITAMIFDPPERRLITALKNGTIKLWNFNNGACLMEIFPEERTEINCIFYMSHKIYVTDWSRRVTWYRDSRDENKVIECKHWKSYHSEDILCVDGHGNKLLATASSNGDIVLWSINSGQAFCRFNASESPLALVPKRMEQYFEYMTNICRHMGRAIQEFFVKAESPIQSGDASQAGGAQGESEKKYWAYPRTELLSKSTIPLRPSSAKHILVSPSPSKRPSSAVSGSLNTKPQAAWSSTASKGSSNLLGPSVTKESVMLRKQNLSWQEEVKASQRAVQKGFEGDNHHLELYLEAGAALRAVVLHGYSVVRPELHMPPHLGQLKLLYAFQGKPHVGEGQGNFSEPLDELAAIVAEPQKTLQLLSGRSSGQVVGVSRWFFCSILDLCEEIYVFFNVGSPLGRSHSVQCRGRLGRDFHCSISGLEFRAICGSMASFSTSETLSSHIAAILLLVSCSILFLKTRERKPNVAILLTSCMDGFLYAWSVGNKGGMMGKFRATHDTAQDTVVSTMSTDDKDLILLTGDSLGYIKIWDIMNYCTGSDEQGSKLDLTEESPEKNAFHDLIPDYCRIASTFSENRKIQQEHDGWVTSLIPPVCLSSWKGHLKNVVSLKYVEKFQAILTASHDRTIKLWLLTGRHIGTFGQSLWRLGVAQLMPAEVPEEIRRVASLHTLKVLNEGRQPHWESTRKIVQTLSQQRREHSLMMELLKEKSSLSFDAVGRMQDLISKDTRMTQYSEEQIEASFQKWEESGKKKSDILGHAYKPKGRRPLLKQLPEVKASVANKDQPRIYHCIQYTDLHPVVNPQIPEVLAEAQQMQALADIRGLRKGKRWMAVSGVLKPTLKNLLVRRNALLTKE
ncbi:EF-hand calcium-binding domain-containing protein 8 [Candoia aspera]|uniref:EF-hand calcium-binding domain-containing protein 8 n=1 Tax=Candoia aspera TaxID=51853 RepID=UPI002FD80592